jgi:hypothetical protein
VRAWALEDGRTVLELRERYVQLEQVGQIDAVIYDIDGETLVGVGAFLTGRARAIKQAAARDAAARESAAAAPAGV